MITGHEQSSSSIAQTSRPSLIHPSRDTKVQFVDKDHNTTARKSPDDVMTVDAMEDGINRVAVSTLESMVSIVRLYT